MAINLTLSMALEGFLNYKTATGKSPHTLADYRSTFKKLPMFFKDNPQFTSITRAQLVAFFAWLQHEHVSVPDGVAPRGEIRLSAKTIQNIHTNLSALWSWAKNEELVAQNIVRTIKLPKVAETVVEPFTREDVQALLQACEVSRSWKTRAETANKIPTGLRNRALVMMLLDTGARASEICGIHFNDLNLKVNSVRLRGKGPGRDGKERLTYFSKRTSQALWKYLLPRLETIRENEMVFVAGEESEQNELDRNALRKMLGRLGERAGVANVHPHRFRHTFAINYLRNGGDVFTLQALLGHSSLEMVKRYARVAQADCEASHRKASPVDNWKL